MTVGTTRLQGNAGASIDITAFLAGDLTENRVTALVNNLGWVYGVGANAVQIVYADTVPVPDGTPVTLNLYDGSLLDAFGRALTLKAIKLLYIKNTSTDSGLTIGGGGAADLLIFVETTYKMYIPPGGVFLWSCPSAAGVVTVARPNLYLLDDGTGAAGDKNIEVIAMGVDYTSSSSSHSSSSHSSSSSSVSSSHSSSSSSVSSSHSSSSHSSSSHSSSSHSSSSSSVSSSSSSD